MIKKVFGEVNSHWRQNGTAQNGILENFKAKIFVIPSRTLLKRTNSVAGPEGLDKKTFKIRTQVLLCLHTCFFVSRKRTDTVLNLSRRSLLRNVVNLKFFFLFSLKSSETTL
jgi:hypothetical protein